MGWRAGAVVGGGGSSWGKMLQGMDAAGQQMGWGPSTGQEPASPHQLSSVPESECLLGVNIPPPPQATLCCWGLKLPLWLCFWELTAEAGALVAGGP